MNDNTIALVTGLLGIILGVFGTIMMLFKLKIDTSKLYKIKEEDLAKYDGRDAYLNLRQQLIDAIKHTNKGLETDSSNSIKWIILISIGSALQVISLVFSLS